MNWKAVLISALMLAGSMTAQSNATKPAAKPAAGTTVSKPAKAPERKRPAVVTSARHQVVVVRQRQAKAAPVAKTAAPALGPSTATPAVKHGAKVAKVAKGEASQAEGQPTEKTVELRGRRDPFVSPIEERVERGPDCRSGRKCLRANEVVLQGIAQTSSGNIAMVANPGDKKVYFLHVNDPILNGVVQRITAHEVVFVETEKDRWGHSSKHEIVRRLINPEA